MGRHEAFESSVSCADSFLLAFRDLITATASNPEHVQIASELSDHWDRATVGANRIRLIEIAVAFLP